MPQKWSELSQSDEFKALPPEEQEKSRAGFFEQRIAPYADPERVPGLRKEWDARTRLPRPAAPAANVAKPDANVAERQALARPASAQDAAPRTQNRTTLPTTASQGGQVLQRPGRPQPTTQERTGIDRVTGGSWDALKSGAQTTMANIGLTLDAWKGDAQSAMAGAMEARDIAKTPEQRAFTEALAGREETDSIWGEIKNVGAAAIEEPVGALHEVVAQTPNSGTAMAGMYAGAKMGRKILSPLGKRGEVLGAFVGGVAGAMFGTSLVETGAITQDKAADGQLTEQELSEATRQGATKSAVIGTIDRLTMGVTGFMFSRAGRQATEAATEALARQGVDVTSEEAVQRALSDPATAQMLKSVITSTAQKANTAGRRLGRGTAGMALESTSEGLGEYFGSSLAGLDPSVREAVLEGLLSMPQSTLELLWSRGEAQTGTPYDQMIADQERMQPGATPPGDQGMPPSAASDEPPTAPTPTAGGPTVGEGAAPPGDDRPLGRVNRTGVDQLIDIARKMGFDEEATRLGTFKKVSALADRLYEEGNVDAAMRLHERAERIHRDIMGEDSSLIQEAERAGQQLPAVYTYEGAVEGTTDLAAAGPGQQQAPIEGELYEEPGRLPAPPKRLTMDGVIYAGDGRGTTTPPADQPGDAPPGRLQRPGQAEPAPAAPTWSDAPVTEAEAPEESRPVLQNRNRSTPASIEQMASIANNPDYTRLGFSRDFANGAPVVEPGAQIRPEQLGRQDVATTAGGRQIPVQYAVVEADQLLPSNRWDGSRIPEYEQGLEGASRTIAGNGRAAGLQRAYDQGNADGYREGIAADASLHGIPAEVLAGMQRPVLVRIMPREEITDNIGDESNTVGTASLSPGEQARNDTRRVDVAAVELDDNGEPTQTAVEQFIATMPAAERAGLMDGKRPNRQAYDRLSNAVFANAYESDELLRLAAEATDPEVRTIMAGLKIAAGKMSRLKGAGSYDIRGLVVEAAEAAINAKRAGESLREFITQGDMGRNPAVVPILEMMADNIRSAKRIGENLSALADVFYAEANLPAEDMFGAVQKRAPGQLLDEFYGANTQAGQPTAGGSRNPGSPGEPRGPEPAPGGNEGQTVAPVEGSAGQPQADPESTQEVTPEGQPARTGIDNPDGQVSPPGEFTLSGETEAEREAREKAEREAREAEEKARREAEEKARKEKEAEDDKTRADETVDDFQLGQSAEQQLSGQTGMFDAPADPVAIAAADAATSPTNDTPAPTEGQIEAGNYKKGHVRWNGLDITIENPAGTRRRPEWPELNGHYGYIKRTEGADGEHVDVFLNPDENRTDKVVVIDQYNGGKKSGGFDEHKVMLGYPNKMAAINAYKANYTRGWQVGPATEMGIDEFKAWLQADTTQPVAKPASDQRFNFSAVVRNKAGEPFHVNSRRGSRASLAPFENGRPAINNMNPTVDLSEYTFSDEWWEQGQIVQGRAPEPAGTGRRSGATQQEEQRPRDNPIGKKLLQNAERNDATYGPRSLQPLAVDIANQTLDKLRRLNDAEKEALAEKHDVPVGVVEQFATQNGWDYVLGLSENGNEDAKAMRNMALAKNRPSQDDQKPAAAAQRAEPSEQKPADPLQDKLDDIDAEIDAAAAELADLLKPKPGTLNTGVDPQILVVGAKLGALYVQKGVVKFAQWSRAIVAKLRELGVDSDQIKPHLKEIYAATQQRVDDEQFDQMDDARTVRRADIDSILADQEPKAESDNAERTPGDPAADRGNRKNEVQPAAEDLQDGGRGRRGSGADGTGRAAGGRGSQAGQSVGDRGTAADRERSDQLFHDEKSRLEDGAARDTDDPGSRPDSTGGLFAERTADGGADRLVESTSRVIPKPGLQEAENKPADLEQIKAQMPFLTVGQAEDVAFAERRLAKTDGFGVLFTNGTGTGKTFTGLGILKRMLGDGKRRILIGVPKQPIADAWVNAARDFFGIKINKLSSTSDAGKGVVVTTYANMGDNTALAKESWDAFFMDEAHYLASNQQGDTTKALAMLNALGRKTDAAGDLARLRNYELFARIEELNKRATSLRRQDNDNTRAEESEIEKELERLYQERNEALEAAKDEVAGTADDEKPRSVFLSATPFAYEKNVRWAQEWLFDWNPKNPSGRMGENGYNSGSNYDRFMMTHFGYRMRYNKLTEPDSKVDRGLMQRAFNTWLRKEGVLSARALDSDFDYDRRFVMAESAIGRRVDAALEWLREKSSGDDEIAGMNEIREKVAEQFDYHSRMYFLEAIKARESLDHIRAHLDLGRKVLVVHDFKKGGTANPFKMEISGESENAEEVRAAYEAFRVEFKDLIEAFSSLPSPIDQLSRAFPEALIYNGDVTAKNRIKLQDRFNSDAQGSPQLMIAQSDAMREGVSIHDTSGKHPRVEINLGMPGKPTAAIQLEGRIYRTGQASDAMFRYFTIGTNWERYAFASKIAGRTSAAENLAMGEEARGLKEAFINAYEEADVWEPGYEGEGSGGKEADKAYTSALTPWDMAKSFYFGTKKQGRGRAARGREGKDYFATPEPVGLKMVQMADLRGGESALEPSAGHGAIARWFPENTTNRAIEFEDGLASKTALHFDGQVQTGDFMQHNVVNKYDAIVMNPPFGQGGAQARDHVAKAIKHLRDGGRIVALVPTGPAADAKFEKLLYSDAAKDIYLAGEIRLPAVTFERAGTGVMTRILVLEKQTDPDLVAQIQQQNRDYTNADDISELFDRMESLELRPRSQPAQPAESEAQAPEAGEIETWTAEHTKTGDTLYMAKPTRRLEREEYKQVAALAKEKGGYWSRFGKAGFLFKSEEARSEFVAELGGGASEPDGSAPAFSRSVLANALMGVDQASRQAAEIHRRLGLDKGGASLEVVATEAELPEAIRQHAEKDGATGQIEGVFHNNTVYVVASSVRSEAHLEEIIAHEGLGHFGARKLLGEDIAKQYDLLFFQLGGVKGMRSRLEARGIDFSEYLKTAERMGSKDQAFYLTDEFLAHMQQAQAIETLPEKIRRKVRELYGAIRDWMRKMKMAKLADLNDSDLALLLRRMRQSAVSKKEAGATQRPVFMAAGNDYFANEVLAELAQHDEFFRYPVSNKHSLEGVFGEVSPGFRLIGDDTRIDEDRESGAATRTLLQNPQGKDFHVYETGDEVWIDVSRFDEGERGSAVYAAVANYAHNTGKQFVGDPAGLTAEATIRRTSNMLSSALRMGTTRHLEAAIEQKRGDPENGIAPLDWTGTDVDKVRALINTFLANLHSQFPAIKSYRYDFSQRQFVDRRGQPVDGDRFELAGELGGARAAKAGQATLRRGILLQSLVESEGGARPGILEQVFTRGHSLVRDGGLDAVFSRARHPFTLSGNNPSDSSQTGVTAQSLLARHWDGEPASSAQAAIREALRTKQPDVVDWLRVNRNRIQPAERGDIVFSRAADTSRVRPAADSIVSGHTPEVDPRQAEAPLEGGSVGADADWVLPGETKMSAFTDKWLYRLQNKQVDLKRVQQAIRATGREINEAHDAYLKEELFHGRSAARVNEFLEGELEPLIADMAARGVTQEELGRYLWARHAKEANAHIADINPEYPDGGSGMTDAEADAYMADLSPEQQANFEALAARVDAMMQKTRDDLVNDELISAQDRETWESTYQFYVPLFRENEAADDGDLLTHGMGTGQGYSIKGAETKRRTGSALPVADILGNIANARDRAIVRGEKARVGRALYALALTNKNPDFWQTTSQAPLIKTHDKDGNVIEVPDPLFKQRDNVVVVKLKTAKGNVVERAVVFNKRNERAMRMAHAVKNLDGQQLGELLGTTASVTRYFAQINTQYNPIFGVVNLVRDTQAALVNLSSTPLAGRQGAVASNMASIIGGALKNGGRRFSDDWMALAKEFEEAGGKTGYRDMFASARERTEDIQKALDPEWWTKHPWGKALTANGYLKDPAVLLVDKGVKPVFDWLSDYNDTLENATRLAVYKEARDQGLSMEASASIAKNITTNFNRKGELALQAGALFAFFNAAVQGTARVFETVAAPAGKRILAGGIMVGVMQGVMMALAGYDDDEPPQFVRERNLIFPIPGSDGKYLSLAMPLGFHVLPNLGRLMVETVRGGRPAEKIGGMMAVLADAFNPLGGSAPMAQLLAPTAADPFVALSMNEDWTGKPIAREDFSSLNPTPGFTRSRDLASAPAVALAKLLNAVTGGTDYRQGLASPTGDQIDYLVGQLTGGIGREAIKTATTVTSMFTADELPAYKIPLLGRFYGETTGQASEASRFYSNIKRLNEHQNTVKGLRGDRKGNEAMRYLIEHPEARLFDQGNRAYRQVQKLRKQRSELADRGASKARLKQVDQQITRAMAQLNERMAASG